MKDDQSNVDLFVGGSLSSLILATHHKTQNPSNRVVIIEGLPDVGGGNGSYVAKNGEFFDYGMRVYYECNIAVLDTIVARSLPTEGLVILEDNKKDLAANYFNGEIHLNSPCLDLRGLSSLEKKIIMDQIQSAPKGINKTDYQNCSKYLIDRLGLHISEHYLFPILENLYEKKVTELTVDASTAHFGLNERIILFDENQTLSLLDDEHLRMRIAFPEQTRLPFPYSKRKSRGLYPSQIGMQRILHGLKENFLKVGGEFRFNSRIRSIGIKNEHVVSIKCANKRTGIESTIFIRKLFWGLPTVFLANLLGYSTTFELERGKRAHLAHFIFNKKLNLGELYYLFNFDSNYDVFRIVNYSAYCPDSRSDGGFRTTVEYWSNSNSVNCTKIYNEIAQMSVISKSHKILFQEMASGPAFPLQSVKNEKHLDEVRSFVNSKKLKNLMTFGQSSKKHTFYTPDILTSAFADYNNLCQ